MAVVLLAAWGIRPWRTISLAVGDQDGLVLRGFHDAQSANGVPYRYAKGGERRPARASVIRLPQVGRCRAGLLVLQVHTPVERPAVALHIVAGGVTVLQAAVQGPATLRVPLTEGALPGGDLEAALLSPAWTKPGDRRSLGVALERLSWTPLGWTWPPARQLWTFPALGVILWGIGLALGLSLRRSTGVASAIAGVAAVCAAWRPLELAPFSHRLLILAAAWYEALLVCCLLLREPGTPPWRLPSRLGPRALTLLAFSGFWALWGFHAFLCRDSAGAFCPSRRVSALGVATGACLAALALVRSREPRLRLASIGITLSAALHGLLAAVAAFRRSAVDFETVWAAARATTAGQSPYRVGDVVQNHLGAVFKVPPLYGMVLRPLARLDLSGALVTYRVLNVAVYLACGVLLVRLLRGHLPALAALSAVAVVMGLMQPAFDTIAYGQIDVVLLALVTAAFLAMRGERPCAAGFCIAFGTSLKLYPVLLAVFAVARRQWRVAAWTAAWLALLTGMAVAVVGWQAHVVYATAILPRIGSGTGWVENQTINGFLCRLVTGEVAPQPYHGLAVQAITYAGFVLVIGLSFIAASRTTAAFSGRRALQYGLFVLAMLVAVPAAWMHYSTITVLPVLALVWDSAERPFRPPAAFALGVAFGLVAYGNQWTFFDGSRPAGLALLALSLKFYGLVTLWALLLARTWSRWGFRDSVVPQVAPPAALGVA